MEIIILLLAAETNGGKMALLCKKQQVDILIQKLDNLFHQIDYLHKYSFRALSRMMENISG